MKTYLTCFQIKGEELNQIMEDLDEARKKINECGSKLLDLGLLTFEEKKEEAANGN